ncbi:MAG: hypothetical protein WCL08_03460 [Verrucomicrobiota bacterium]
MSTLFSARWGGGECVIFPHQGFWEVEQRNGRVATPELYCGKLHRRLAPADF